jgi:AcrR family transcriptional regulator
MESTVTCTLLFIHCKTNDVNAKIVWFFHAGAEGMPRTPDPELEGRIVDAAMRLLDRGGEGAITMRSVAREAGTTTPTIYERFPDREALMRQVAERGTDELFSILQPVGRVENMCREYLRFSCAHPQRFDLTVEIFGARFVAGEPRPVFDLFKSRLTEEIGVTGRKCEDLALAIAFLFAGTARGMVAAGGDTHHADELRRASLAALRLLLKAFSGPADPGRRTG